MLLDLGRNDVGRVSKAGSVKVTDKMLVEYYSHVMHIVSNVEGEVKSNKDILSLLMSGFPAGTVSGAPKLGLWKLSTNEPTFAEAYMLAVSLLLKQW